MSSYAHIKRRCGLHAARDDFDIEDIGLYLSQVGAQGGSESGQDWRSVSGFGPPHPRASKPEFAGESEKSISKGGGGARVSLPKYFKSLFWFADFDKVSLEKDRDLILFQALEKGRMEHLKYLERKLGARAIYNFAKQHASKFSRKSIVSFAKVMFSGARS